MLKQQNAQSSLAEEAPLSAVVREDVSIAVRDVRKQFEISGKAKVALEDVNLDVHDSEFLVLLGPSGCGKTTLLRIIAGLIAPTDGRIEFSSKIANDGSGAALGDALGFVFQEPNLMPWRTVLENIALPLEIKGWSRKDRLARAEEMSEFVKLSGFNSAFPRQLSGGMRQRVAIARALAFDPAVLLMDEPFGALDALTRDVMGLELQRLWSESKKTVIFVTHSIPEAVLLADRIVTLSAHPGRIASIRDIPFERPRTLDILQDADFNQIVRELRSELEA